MQDTSVTATGYGTPLLRFSSTEATQTCIWVEASSIAIMAKVVGNNKKYEA